MTTRLYMVEVVCSPASFDGQYVTKVTYYDPRGWDHNRVGYGRANDEHKALTRAFETVTNRAVEWVD